MTTVVQIAPEIGPGSGVAGVAHHLEEQLRARGIATSRFTLAEAYGSWLPEPGPGISGKASIAARVIWFSTVGTVLARRTLHRHPDAVGDLPQRRGRRGCLRQPRDRAGGHAGSRSTAPAHGAQPPPRLQRGPGTPSGSPVGPTVPS